VTEPDELDLDEGRQRERIQAYIDGQGKLILIAEFRGEVVGYVNFQNGSRRRIAHRGDLDVAVREAWRGQGIGTALIAALLAWAQGSPVIEKVRLKVFADHAEAIRLYQRRGFIEEGRERDDMKLAPGVYADSILMYRFVRA